MHLGYVAVNGERTVRISVYGLAKTGGPGNKKVFRAQTRSGSRMQVLLHELESEQTTLLEAQAELRDRQQALMPDTVRRA